MKAFKIYITLIAWVGIALYSKAQPTCTINSTSQDPNWNWQSFDAGVDGWQAYLSPAVGTGETTSVAFTISPPWNISNSDQLNTLQFQSCTGANQTTCPVFCTPANGWVFIHKEFGQPGTAAQGTSAPYFVLYNKFLGLLRVFFYITSSVQDNSGACITVSFLSPEGNTNQTALLSNTGTVYSAALDNYNNNMSMTVPNAFYNTGGLYNNMWLCADFPMTYDPCTCMQNAEINVAAYELTTQTVQLTTVGNITGTSTSIVSNSQGQVSSNGFSSVIDGLDGFLNVFTDATHLSGVLNEYQDNLETHQLGGLGDIIQTNLPEVGVIADGIAAVAPEVGLLLGAATFISALTGSGSGNDGSQITVINNYNLKINTATSGTITTNYPFGNGVISVPGSAANGANIQASQIPLYSQPLGVFNLATTPNLQYTDYYNVAACYSTSSSGPLQPCNYPSSAEVPGNPAYVNNVYRQYSLKGVAPQFVINPVVLNDYELTDIQGALVIDYLGTGLFSVDNYDPANLDWNGSPLGDIPAFVGQPNFCATAEQRMNTAGLYFEAYPYSGSSGTPSQREAFIRTPYFSLPELAQQSFFLNQNSSATAPNFYIKFRITFTKKATSSATSNNLYFAQTFAVNTPEASIPANTYYGYQYFNNAICTNPQIAGCSQPCNSTGGTNGFPLPFLQYLGIFVKDTDFNSLNSSIITTNIPYNTTISNTTVTGTNTYQAYGNVTIGPGVTFAPGSNTTIIAGQGVIITQGTSFGGGGGPAYIAGPTVTIPPSTQLYPGTTITIANPTNLPNNIISLQNAPLPSPITVSSSFCTSTYSVNTKGDGDQATLRKGTQNLQASTTKTPGVLANVEIYPNPSQGLVQVALNFNVLKGVSVSVTNPLGEQIFTTTEQVSKGIIKADLSAQPAGIYIVQVTAGNDVTTSKIIIAH